MGDTLRSPTVTTKLQRLAEQAAHDPQRVFTTLAHLIDEDFLPEVVQPISPQPLDSQEYRPISDL
jgi:hypothetical protein